MQVPGTKTDDLQSGHGRFFHKRYAGGIFWGARPSSRFFQPSLSSRRGCDDGTFQNEGKVNKSSYSWCISNNGNPLQREKKHLIDVRYCIPRTRLPCSPLLYYHLGCGLLCRHDPMNFQCNRNKLRPFSHHTLLHISVVFSLGIMTERATPRRPALLSRSRLRQNYRYSLFLNKQFQTKYAKSNQDFNGGPNCFLTIFIELRTNKSCMYRAS